jgi:hypothetical protein
MLGLDVLHPGRVKIHFALTASRVLSAGTATSTGCK